MTDKKYLEMLQKQKEKEREETRGKSWSFPPDNGATGEALKDYYRRHGYI